MNSLEEHLQAMQDNHNDIDSNTRKRKLTSKRARSSSVSSVSSISPSLNEEDIRRDFVEIVRDMEDSAMTLAKAQVCNISLHHITLSLILFAIINLLYIVVIINSISDDCEC
jgi:hypothetical protein